MLYSTIMQPVYVARLRYSILVQVQALDLVTELASHIRHARARNVAAVFLESTVLLLCS